jgi:DNA modification methylase
MSENFLQWSVTLKLGDNKFQLRDMALYSNLVYGDCIYEIVDTKWTELAYENLVQGGVFIVQTDWHTNYLYRDLLENKLGAHFVNHLVWKNEWGNHPKNRFHQCYDDILVFSKGKDYKFYPERIQVPKATVGSRGLNPSGRNTKTATAWIDDITLTTIAKERVKKKDGHNIRWQKPLKLYDRIVLPFTDNFDNILDPFSGSGSLAKWCLQNKRNYLGIELDEEVYSLSVENLSK